MIGGHLLLQIDVIEHRRLGIGGTHHDSSPPDGAFSYHTCDGRKRGFVNNLLGAYEIAAQLRQDLADTYLL